jgi:hypothetical protein
MNAMLTKQAAKLCKSKFEIKKKSHCTVSVSRLLVEKHSADSHMSDSDLPGLKPVL